MIILPAIDLKAGQVVRLEQGDFTRKTIYSNDPLAVARQFSDQGAEWLHLVDLDGAAGQGKNFSLIKQIASQTELKLQTGGGVRSQADVANLLQIGVERVVIGTLAVKNPELLQKILIEFGSESILVSLDARQGKIATSGWLEESDQDLVDFAIKIEKLGVKYILYTDIGRDGMLSGPDLIGLGKIKEATDLKVIASGGISSKADLYRLAERNFYGAITGQAIYQNKINLKEILTELGD
ncbi:1-(5-phosphoribosyl)-5-[(5-phosphoribosylamino)methylideneamino]imidazole-4-carboxamide isomerase [Halanaerobium salsuginis]|uniref:1-(5-phosphoribosyl)-5-[(5-phosphoribosylamino)methylideneamino] imidazole-4-carboxamide isomerase n=1 Tax=Halanaerobium salsuginis TaxID=29563 RepID=A0A1I4L049_9FIRM|nr:1-(5-phosphoribosyl)-5-[(5-phosphoribosylamino)methylideneamino]imidazole-4-carboxamide isomerase [Halanaerobium salsuginis]SFL84388.1 1-(5-phosphoribosyl)-5-[(5-phosphoribosylamino)methylideneamino] imidazole-4-carboxamide isomerase [Halanaerobium salsuginis]